MCNKQLFADKFTISTEKGDDIVRTIQSESTFVLKLYNYTRNRHLYERNVIDAISIPKNITQLPLLLISPLPSIDFYICSVPHFQKVPWWGNDISGVSPSMKVAQ